MDVMNGISKSLLFHLILSRSAMKAVSRVFRQSNIKSSTNRLHRAFASNMSTNEHGQGASHATDSALPQSVQEKVPKHVEEKVPDAAHDTGSNAQTGKVSHATGDSKVPQALQEGLPEKVEKAVPNAIHDTSGAKFSDGSVSK